MNPLHIIALAEAVLRLVDLTERTVLRQMDDPAEVEAYIAERTRVRESVMALAREADPQAAARLPAGDDPAHGYIESPPAGDPEPKAEDAESIAREQRNGGPFTDEGDTGSVSGSGG